MKSLKIITLLSIISLFVLGYFYQSTKSELSDITQKYTLSQDKDSIIIMKDKQIEKLEFELKSDTLLIIKIDSLLGQLSIEKNKFNSFELESKFKYQKIVTEKTEMGDKITSLKSELENINESIDRKNKLIVNHKKLIKKFEVKIDSLIREIDTREEPVLFIIEEPTDSLEILPEIKIEEDLEINIEKDSKKKRKKKRKKS